MVIKKYEKNLANMVIFIIPASFFFCLVLFLPRLFTRVLIFAIYISNIKASYYHLYSDTQNNFVAIFYGQK